MIFDKRVSLFFFSLIFIAIIFIQVESQTFAPTGEREQRQAASHKEPEPDDVDLLKIKVGQLQALVEQQQSALAEMDRRVKKLEEKNQASTSNKKESSQ